MLYCIAFFQHTGNSEQNALGNLLSAEEHLNKGPGLPLDRKSADVGAFVGRWVGAREDGKGAPIAN